MGNRDRRQYRIEPLAQSHGSPSIPGAGAFLRKTLQNPCSVLAHNMVLSTYNRTMSGDTISVLEARLEETIGANERLHQTILRMYADIQRLTAENQKLTKDANK